jgi:hypothetical protein
VLLTNHVLSGALIGALARRPLPAFAAGVASHFLLDAVPHWGDWGSPRAFLRVAVPDGLASLALIGAFAAAAPPERRLAVVAGMAGAALPDIDKPTTLWFGWSPFPAAVDRFHAGIQREAQSRYPVEVLAAGGFGSAALAALRGRRRLPGWREGSCGRGEAPPRQRVRAGAGRGGELTRGSWVHFPTVLLPSGRNSILTKGDDNKRDQGGCVALDGRRGQTLCGHGSPVKRLHPCRAAACPRVGQVDLNRPGQAGPAGRQSRAPGRQSRHRRPGREFSVARCGGPDGGTLGAASVAVARAPGAAIRRPAWTR